MAKPDNRQAKPEAAAAPDKAKVSAAPVSKKATPPASPAPASPGESGSGMPVMVRWFLSKTVRQATAMRKHVQKLLNHQRDILAPPASEAIQAAIAECQQAVALGANKANLEKQMESLEKAANKWLKAYPNAAWRENVEVLLVALAVAMGIRTFFLQPFKIPTGSMQPTLFGVTSENLLNQPDYKIPTGLARIREWFAGVSYIQATAQRDGTITAIEPPHLFKFGWRHIRLPFLSLKQKIYIDGESSTIWFPPDYGTVPLEGRAGIYVGQRVRKGEQIVKLKVSAGDHLFVDRLTYNFRPPKRGEIIVFETKGIYGLPQDQFYIKRMVAMGGDKVQIGDDRHLVINGKRLDASTPHFENVYSFNPKDPPRDSHYSGHVNFPGLAPYFQDKPEGVSIQPDHYMVMGDNTMNSLDSRSWGDFPATNVIGKSFFVYWPITDRFGWGNR